MNSEVKSGVFVAAHELKSPLSLMRQLALSIEPDDKDSITFAKEKIIETSERAIRQVNDLTKVARLEDGVFNLEPVSVRAVCDDVTRELRFLYRENHRELRAKYSNRHKLAYANHDMLFSIVYNFCANALHYSDENTYAEIKVCDKKGRIEVSVRDFGPALPTKIWKQMKKDFISEPTSVAMRPGSSGLGLYISSKFAEFMNCNVSAVRHADGTSFTLDLPISSQIALPGV